MLSCFFRILRLLENVSSEGMIWARLDLNRNFHLDSEPKEWPFALSALGLTDHHMMGYLAFLDHDRDGAISLPVCSPSSPPTHDACSVWV